MGVLFFALAIPVLPAAPGPSYVVSPWMTCFAKTTAPRLLRSGTS